MPYIEGDLKIKNAPLIREEPLLVEVQNEETIEVNMVATPLVHEGALLGAKNEQLKWGNCVNILSYTVSLSCPLSLVACIYCVISSKLRKSNSL